jgi:hypothetical protein
MKSDIRGETAASCGPRVNMSVHRDAEDQAQHFISVIEDVTERRTLEAQVRQANKRTRSGDWLRALPTISTICARPSSPGSQSS